MFYYISSSNPLFKGFQGIKKRTSTCIKAEVLIWRRHPDLNWGMRVLQTLALPLGYSALFWSGLRGSNSLPPPWQGGALPDELNPHN